LSYSGQLYLVSGTKFSVNLPFNFTLEILLLIYVHCNISRTTRIIQLQIYVVYWVSVKPLVGLFGNLLKETETNFFSIKFCSSFNILTWSWLTNPWFFCLDARSVSETNSRFLSRNTTVVSTL